MKGHRKLGRPTAHRKAMLRNQVTDLLREGRITTTITRAKETRRMAEKMITLGKRGDLHARRQARADGCETAPEISALRYKREKGSVPTGQDLFYVRKTVCFMEVILTIVL